MSKKQNLSKDPLPPKKFRLFSPILSGASLYERLWACVGALIGICLTGFICGLAFGHNAQLPLIVAPIGASAVLLFAVPASPLAQPWPIIGGNTISAFAGVASAHFIGDPLYAVGIAVSLAILAMSLTRSLHPPGGAAALTAVVGGVAVRDAGFWFPLIPVAINSVALVVLGVLFHKFSKHSYPHRPSIASINTHKTTDAAPAVRVWFTTEDIDSAIADLHETLDISRGDIDALLRRVEQRALNRAHGELKCRDIMSKDVVFVGSGASAEEVSALLRYHHLKTLPVVGEDGRLVGTVSYPELAHVNSNEPLRVSKASTARPDDIAIGLLPVLTDGQTHNVIIVSEDNHIVGIVSQTDLLVALGKNLLWHLPKKK